MGACLNGGTIIIIPKRGVTIQIKTDIILIILYWYYLSVSLSFSLIYIINIYIYIYKHIYIYVYYVYVYIGANGGKGLRVKNFWVTPPIHCTRKLSTNEKWRNDVEYLNRYFRKPKIPKKTSMIKVIKNLWYIKDYS